jgi:organic radical activating enzyme
MSDFQRHNSERSLRHKIPIIDTEKVAAKFRSRIIDLQSQKILVTDFTGSEQAQDLSVPPNCDGIGRIRHFRRSSIQGWPVNPLPIDPATSALGLPNTDLIRAQVFQNAACAWRCWYCFVPYSLLSGDERHARWVTTSELLDLYVNQQDPPPIIDLTGGSPDLTPEWPIWMIRSIRERGLEEKVYLWSDDNLSTDYLWTKLTPSDRELLSSFPHYGRVACFKGFDESSFAFNTGASEEEFQRQFIRFRKLLDLKINLYAYVTLTANNVNSVAAGIPKFIDRLQAIHPNLPLRTIPLQIASFTPVQARLNPDRELSLQVQMKAIELWVKEIDRRFNVAQRSLAITDVRLH